MSKYYEQLIEEFQKIKDLGWVKATRGGNTGIGKTFEDLLNKKEDNLSTPDYGDIEIKSQRSTTTSMITLFTKSPTYPRGVNTLLRESFGNNSPDHDGKKILHTTVSSKSFNTHVGGYGFKIKIDNEFRRLELQVCKNNTGEIVYNNAYWSFDVLENILKTKLKHIAYVEADEKMINGKNHFNYTNIKFITDFTFENFLKALKNGDILVDIRIGVYNSGKNKGRTHDHGTGFRIKFDKLLEYATIVQI